MLLNSKKVEICSCCISLLCGKISAALVTGDVLVSTWPFSTLQFSKNLVFNPEGTETITVLYKTLWK